MSEQEKLILETKKEIRSILLSTKAGIEFTRLNREYEMFTGSRINYRGMGFTSLRAFVDSIPDVARQFDDGYGTITLLGVADESTRHIASLVSRQRGKKKSIRGRHYPGPRIGILSNMPYNRSAFSFRSAGDSHSSYGSRYSRTITRSNPFASPVTAKLLTSASVQITEVIPQLVRPLTRAVGRETVVPPLMTLERNLKVVGPSLRNVVPESQTEVQQPKTFVPNLKEKLLLLVQRISGNTMYSSLKKSFEKEFGAKLDVAECGYKSVSDMFSSLGIPVWVKPFCSDDYTIVPGRAAGDMEKEQRQRSLAGLSIPVFSVERPAAANEAKSIGFHAPESLHLPYPQPVPQPPMHSLEVAQPMHSLEVAQPIHVPSMTSRPSSRRMSLVSHTSRSAPVSDKPRLPSTPSVSQELRDAISQVLKNSPDGILMGDLQTKLKEVTGINIDIEATGARSLEHLLVNVPEIVLMQYRGHGQLLLFDPGQSVINDNIDQRQNFDQKEGVMGQMQESRSKLRDIPEDSVGPDQVITNQKLLVGANEYLPIYVSSVVSPGHFWFQIDGEQYNNLVVLMETLQSTYNHVKGCKYEMPPFLMKIGQLCAARFPEDRNWHRGSIMGFKDSLVQIYFLDYGTTSFVTKDQLRILRSRYLTLPAQAIRARLSNVQPVGGEWSEAAYTFFMKHFMNKRLTALITSITQDGLVSVCLTDTNGEKDVHLNDCLVIDGYAIMQADDYEPTVSVPKNVDKSTSCSVSNSVDVKPSKTADGDESILITEQDIKFVQLPPNYGCHMVRIWDKLYIISNEISTFLWKENVLRTMVRQKGYGYLPKLVLRIEDHLAVMEELAKFKIPGVFVDGVFAEILVLYELSIVIQLLEIFEHKSEELKSELKKHLDFFSANPSKWTTASTVPGARDEDCTTVMSDDLAIRSHQSRCDIDAVNREDVKEGKELQKDWKFISDQRKKLLLQMRDSASPKASAFTVEELSRMESQMKELEDRYDTIQKRLHGSTKQDGTGITDVNCNSEINNNFVTASIADSKAEKIRGLVAAQSPTMQKKPLTNAVAPMTQADSAPATASIRRGTPVPGCQPSTGLPASSGLQSSAIQQPNIGFPPTIRPGLEYGQQMGNLAQMLSQMTISNPTSLSNPVGLFGLAGMGYQLPNPQLHAPFGYSAAQILMQQQQYLTALQGLSSLVTSGSSFPQTPYDSSLLGISNLSYLAHAAPSGSAMPRTNQPEPRQN